MRSLSIRALLSRRYRALRLLVFVAVFTLGYLASVLASSAHGEAPGLGGGHDGLDGVHYSGRRLLNSSDSEKSNYPPDVFTVEQRRKGAVTLHVFGLIYMFVALAVVCDEFFVPSLGVITEKLEISEDVAGATFMAAGGSAPELFTSFIGVFIAVSDVGIGTIVGSAVFNILFVIGMCALFSKDLLHLTWWPLFRDVLFYCVSILLLIAVFLDEKIYWWEAVILFLFYIAYVLFMKYNHVIEAKVKNCLKKKSSRNKVQSSDQLIQQRRHSRRMSIPTLHAGPGRYRHGVLQLMIHTIDPLSEDHHHYHPGEGHHEGQHQSDRLAEPHHSTGRRKSVHFEQPEQQEQAEGKVHEKAVQLQTIATVQLVINHGASNGQNGTATQVDKENNVKIQVISNGRVSEDTSPVANTPNSGQTSITTLERDGEPRTGRDVAISVNSPQHTLDSNSSSETNAEGSGPDDEEEPLDLSWPDTWKKRVTYILLAPIMFLLWIMLPDVRRPEKRKWFPITFIGSILWIAVFSYLMVWWANQTGKTAGISDEVMGLTILAAGTSIPDLITSVIVAKKGFGDMAVSSSVGSNIFDITVGLPLPWILYGAVNAGDPYIVSSKGLPCAIILLFIMIVVVIVTIAVSKWKMTKIMGFSMLVLYTIFVTLAVLLEVDIIPCFV